MNINNESKETIVQSLERIAEEMILNRMIVVNNRKFSIIDVEVYYWHDKHPDNYAKGVKHTRQLGEFELHRYGIDISLGQDENEEFGGILLRGLYDMDKQLTIKKSEIVKSIFNSFKLGNNNFELITEKSPWVEVFKTTRLNLGKKAGEKFDFSNKKYRFLAKSKENKLYEKYPNKEEIFRNSNLCCGEIKQMLGYNLTRSLCSEKE